MSVKLSALHPRYVRAQRDRARAELVPRLAVEMAAATGPIVLVILPDAAGCYDASRLVVERTVTVNTATAGGNTALLSPGGDGG